jgi:hypothetical protein
LQLEIELSKEGAAWSYGSGIYNYLYAISAHHHWCCKFESHSGQSVQHYVIKFVSDLRQVGGFLRVPPPIFNKTDRYNWNVVESGIKHHQTNKRGWNLITISQICSCLSCFLNSILLRPSGLLFVLFRTRRQKTGFISAYVAVFLCSIKEVWNYIHGIIMIME